MPKYIIERTVPGAADLSESELQGIAAKSCSVLVGELGNGYHWVQSFVAGDKIYCIHIAPNEEAVREHARQGGFPVDSVAEVKAIIDPTTAERPIPAV
jgi:hypothetical protein